MQGTIVKGIAGFYYVQAEDGNQYECKAKGIFRKDHNKPTVGDRVRIDILNREEKSGNLVEILERRSLLFRPAVANIDQAAVVFACKDPEPNCNLLDRFLIMMEYFDISVIVCFTKTDLDDSGTGARLQKQYEAAGYPVCLVSIKQGEENVGLMQLKQLLNGKITAFAGPSGVGKSTLLNYLYPKGKMQTGEISEKIKRGKHTTRHSELFYLGGETYLFDTPGFSSLDLNWIEKDRLELYFPEFAPYLGKCKFTGCAHASEPSCAVKDALSRGMISPQRYENYLLFYKELAQIRKYR